MASTVRIDGSLFQTVGTGLVFSNGWAVEYDWQTDRPRTGLTGPFGPDRLSRIHGISSRTITTFA